MDASKTKVGITGHQRRKGIDWNRVRSSLRDEIAKLPKNCTGFSCLAEGSDQIFAEEILKSGRTHHAVIPLKNYEKYFTLKAASKYLSLLEKSVVTNLNGPQTNPNLAFYIAGQHVVRSVDLLIAVWDGSPAIDFGGTADIVAFALSEHTPTITINPINKPNPSD